MIAVGIDLGGTKIAAQAFDADWGVVHKIRMATPRDYDRLIADVAGIVRWADELAGHTLPVGIGAAGLVHPVTGLTVAANLPTHGKPFQSDLRHALDRPLTYLNDSQALALSEAALGAGQGHDRILALVIGTGISGAFCIDRQLEIGPTHTGGEFGHIAAPAHLVQAYDLLLRPCGCGQIGCIETLISGGGLSHLAQSKMTAAQIVACRGDDPGAARAWYIWCALTADLIRTLTRTLDPDCIVLGGGLSKIGGVAHDLMQAAKAAQFIGFDIAPIVVAQGGDTSGARGAAYAAYQAVGLVND